MSNKRSEIYKLCAKALFFALFGVALFSRCANIMAPTGGPRDTLPPRVVKMTPGYGTKNFDQKRIYIEFDEYLKLKDQQKEFFVSPFMNTPPTITMRGRGIQIDIKDTLLPDQTYSLNFGGSVTDNNEGNVLNGFRYVFSTGSSIDSMIMSGYAVDGYTKDSASKTFILFYDADWDSIPAYDSTVFKHKPLAVARAENNGIFIAENLKPMNYRIYALEDKNSNQKYEPGVDKIGFLDTIYNPATMPAFSAWYDTVRKYMVADPQIYFRMFADEQFKRQYLASATRPLQHKAVIHFGAKHPQIKQLTLNGIDSSQIITEYMTPNRDSIALWFNLPSAELPDTIKGEVVYFKHDSINQLVETSHKLALAWKFFETKSKKELKEEKKDSTKIVNPFKFKVDVSGSVNPEKHIKISFDYPLTQVDSSKISLIRLGEEDKMYRVRSSIEHDSVDLRTWTIKAQWAADQKYRLMIPAGVFKNIAGESNDTLRSEFSVISPDKYATIVVNVKGKSPQSMYILQLMGSGNNLIEQKEFVSTGKYTFRYVDPGIVRLRVIEDLNGNGLWDKGNLVERRHSERVEIFTTDDGDDEIATKVNWELEFEVDMNKLFGPITMEGIIEQIERAEAAKMRKKMKELESKTPQYQKDPSSGQERSAPGISPLGGGSMPFNPLNR